MEAIISNGALNLDNVFSSLADATRRDILRRVGKNQLTISEIAAHYKLTFAAISKHLKVLEKARLIVKRRQGKEQLVTLSPLAFMGAVDYLQHYEAIWNQRFNALDKLLASHPPTGGGGRSLKINKRKEAKEA